MIVLTVEFFKICTVKSNDYCFLLLTVMSTFMTFILSVPIIIQK